MRTLDVDNPIAFLAPLSSRAAMSRQGNEPRLMREAPSSARRFLEGALGEAKAFTASLVSLRSHSHYRLVPRRYEDQPLRHIADHMVRSRSHLAGALLSIDSGIGALK